MHTIIASGPVAAIIAAKTGIATTARNDRRWLPWYKTEAKVPRIILNVAVGF